MKFLILTQYFRPEIGAAQTRLDAMARELASQGHEVEIVTALPNYPTGHIFPAYKGCLYKYESTSGIPIHRVWIYPSLGRGIARIVNYLSFSATCVAGLIRSKRPDYLFIESPPLCLSVPGLALARAWDVPSIFNVADLWPDAAVELGLTKDGLFVALARQLERWTYKKATYVTVPTMGLRRILIQRKQVPVTKILFLPNGVDLQQYSVVAPDLQLKRDLGLDGKKVVIYAGTQGFVHGLDSVLQTAALMRGEPIVHFLFLGDGSQRATLEERKSKLELHNTTFLDAVRMSELPRFLSIAECGLISHIDIPITRSGRPAKSGPLLAAAKPIVFFGSGEGADLVRTAKAGRVVPHGDVEGLAEAIREIIRDPELAAELGRNGRRYAEEHLSWSVIVGDWLRQLHIASGSALQTLVSPHEPTHSQA